MVLLELLKETHIEDYLSSFSRAVQSIVGVSDSFQEQDYLKERIEKQQIGKTFFYCILDPEKKQCIGAIEIRDKQEYPGQLYCWLNEQYWGTGVFAYAMRAAAQDYFSHTDEPFFTAHVNKNNKRSYRALKKCGFADTGIYNGPWGKQYQLMLRNKYF